MWNLSHHPPSYFRLYQTKIFPLQNDENDNFLFSIPTYRHILFFASLTSESFFLDASPSVPLSYDGRVVEIWTYFWQHSHLAFTPGLVVFSLCEWRRKMCLIFCCIYLVRYHKTIVTRWDFIVGYHIPISTWGKGQDTFPPLSDVSNIKYIKRGFYNNARG